MSLPGRRNKRWNKYRNLHTEALRLENHVSYKDDWNSCKKKHNHGKFIEVEDLSARIKHEELLKFLKVRSQLTGRLVISLEDERQCGTCSVEQVKVLNENSIWMTVRSSQGHKPKAVITVSTAWHVVTINGEQIPADQCHIELDDADNDEGQDKLRFLHGVKIYGVNKDADFCLLDCVTDNSELIRELNDLVQHHYELGSLLADRYGGMKETDRLVIMVSFPHGYGKRISIGKVRDKDLIKEVRDNQDCCDYTYDTVTCPGSSGASVYVLGKWRDGFGYWFGYPHVHQGAYDGFVGQSSEGVEAAY